MESEKIALIDLDGTVADFNKAIVAALNRTRNPIEREYTDECLDNPPEWLEERMHTIKRVPGFWRDLEPISLGMNVLDLIRDCGYQLNVLTKGPRRNTGAWSEKAEWAQRHIPDAQITVTQDKGLVYGKVLFDDWPLYITRWLKWRPRGLVLMLDHVSNREFNHPNVVRIRGTQDFHTVQEALLKRVQVPVPQSHSPFEAD